MLSASDIAVLQRALALARTRPIAAERLVLELAPAALRHPDALFVRAQALRGQDRFAEARAALEAALAAAPRHPQLHNAHGNCLADLGEIDLALAAFGRATAIDHAYAEAWLNSGIIATRHGHLAVAASALDQARSLRPSDTGVLNALGALAEAGGDRDAALAAYSEALTHDPGDPACLHNLATVLRGLDRAAEALALLDAAPEELAARTATLRAHLLTELGHFDKAVDRYRAIIGNDPGNLDAQGSLARLLPQIGRGAEALDGFAAALRAQASAPVWGAAIAAALAGGDTATALRWIDGAAAAHGANADLALARARGLAALGERAAALTILRGLAARGESATVQVNLAHLLLQEGEAAEAARHAEAATRLAPLEQTGWALLATAWRIVADPRHGWLADYERLVVPIAMDVPAAWSSRAAFVADVAAAVDRHHLTTSHPAGQSLRGGTQTGGNLFDRADPVLRALRDSLDSTVARALADVPRDPSHPFLRRNSGRIVFTGSWSVKLRGSGFHIDHIHPNGWLSSALHIAVPADLTGDAGALRFGVPDAALGLDLPALRTEPAVPGQLVLFPSYFWHGTVPFDSAAPRLTVAFDALPA